MQLFLLPLAHRIAVPFFQLVENDRGEEGHPAKHKEAPLDAVNELWGAGSMAIPNEHGCYERRGSNTETDSHLLRSARDGARAALLFLIDIRIDQRVHA